MQIHRHLAVLVILSSGSATGCGGGGSSTPRITRPSVVDPQPANGSYAGTYSCTTNDGGLVTTTVLPTATGVFSSCSIVAAGYLSLTFHMHRNHRPGWQFKISGMDSHGNELESFGTATATQASGDFLIARVGLSGTFDCKH